VSIETGPEGADVELVEVRDVGQKLARSGSDPGHKDSKLFCQLSDQSCGSGSTLK
jgi:hypothetical protein